MGVSSKLPPDEVVEGSSQSSSNTLGTVDMEDSGMSTSPPMQRELQRKQHNDAQDSHEKQDALATEGINGSAENVGGNGLAETQGAQGLPTNHDAIAENQTANENSTTNHSEFGTEAVGMAGQDNLDVLVFSEIFSQDSPTSFPTGGHYYVIYDHTLGGDILVPLDYQYENIDNPIINFFE